MNPPQRRAPRSRDLRLSLTALLAFLSWAGLLAFFIVIPVLYLRQTAGRDLQALKASWPLSAPLIIGGACAVVILFILYYLMASGLRCQVCGGSVFGGGDTHRKHPNARKFLGLSYSRRVAWEILTSSGFHCMHCQTFCRNRRRGAITETLDPTAGNGAVPAVFQANPSAGETVASSQLFNSLFAPLPSETPMPPAAAEQVPPPTQFPPAPAPAPATSSPFSLVGNPLGAPPASVPQPRPIAHPERPPWAHHPVASPFVETNPVMNPPIPAMPSPMAPPESPAGIRALIPPQPRTAPAAPAPAAGSPFTLFAPPVPPSTDPIPANSNPVQPMSTPFTFPAPPVAAPAMPSPAPAAGPTPAPAPVKAPVAAAAPAAPTPEQVVAQVTKLMEKTRSSLDEMFSKMLGELKKVLETPTASAAPVASAHPATPLPSTPEMVKNHVSPEAPVVTPPQQAPARPAPAAITLPSLPGITPPKIAPAAPAPAPAAPPVTLPTAPLAANPAPEQAAEMNAVLARAFAQSQRQGEPASPAPAASNPASSPDWRTGHPQSPFSLVANQPEPARPAAQQPPNVLPFPPFPQPVTPPPAIPNAPAASLPLPPMMPPASAPSPFAVMQGPPTHTNHGPSFPSPFAGLPELGQNHPEPPPMPAPFTFLSQHGDQFVPDPNKLPPQWPAPAMQAANPAPQNAQALQFAQMQAQQLAQFQAQQMAQLQAQAAQEGAPVPPPFMPQWPTQNGNVQP